MNIKITVDDAVLSASLAKVEAQLKDLSPVMRSISNIMLTGVQDSFRTSTSPHGEKWQGLSSATLKAKAKRGRSVNQILVDSGILMASIQPTSNATEALVSTNMVYAAIHNFGGRAGRNHAVNIPKREFMGLSNDTQTEIIDFLLSKISFN